MKNNITFTKRNSAFARLEDFCIFTEKDKNDFIEVTEWSNNEGYDIVISKKNEIRISLTHGEFTAIKKCIKFLNKIAEEEMEKIIEHGPAYD